MSNPDPSLTPAQIRRRANDYDSQIRQGLEDGNVRQVVKRLGNNLVSKIMIVFLSFTDVGLDLDTAVDPSHEGHARTSGCVPEAVVPVPVHSGVECPQERRELP
jgi:hypothetical protein